MADDKRWSPSPQDRLVEYLERELIDRQKTPPIRVVNVRTQSVLNIVRISKTPEGLVVEVE